MVGTFCGKTSNDWNFFPAPGRILLNPHAKISRDNLL